MWLVQQISSFKNLRITMGTVARFRGLLPINEYEVTVTRPAFQCVFSEVFLACSLRNKAGDEEGNAKRKFKENHIASLSRKINIEKHCQNHAAKCRRQT
jgi:hypothetical protein